jgi:hypothetical protein
MIRNLQIKLRLGDYREMCETLLWEFNSSEDGIWYNTEFVKLSHASWIRHYRPSDIFFL